MTHTLCGMALGRTRLGRRSPLSRWALVVAANLPDIDIVTEIWGGRDAYLEHHRGITHSVAGIVVEALLLSLLVGLTERRRAASRGEPRAGLFASLLPIALGLASHLLLDALNNYGVRPWLPFSDRRYFGDLVSIIDPWMWLIFGGAVLLARGPRVRPALATAAALLLLYLGGRVALREGAWTAAQQDLAASLPGTVVTDHVPRPSGFNPLEWTMIAATREELIRIEVRLAGTDGPPRRYPRNLGDPAVERAAATPTGRAWRRFARLPLAAVTRLPDDRLRVDLMDGRYGLQPGTGWSTRSVTLDAPAPAPEQLPGG